MMDRDVPEGWMADVAERIIEVVRRDGRWPAAVRMNEETYAAILRGLEAARDGNNYNALRVYKVYLGMHVEMDDTREFGELEIRGEGEKV
jgi:hypothetical protein